MTTVPYPPPRNSDDFEELATDVVRLVWADPTACRLGRTGQRQHGIDAFGRTRHLGDQPAVAQFRNVRALDFQKIIDDLAAMDAGLPPPPPKLFIVVTTASRDARVQLELRRVSQDRLLESKSEIQVVFWEDVERLLTTNESLLRRHYPDLAPAALSNEEEARLRAQNALVMHLCPGGSGFESPEGPPVLGCMVINQGETPFRVAHAAATWSFTETFLAVEPRWPRGERHAEVKMYEAYAPPGKAANFNVIMRMSAAEGAQLFRSLNALRGTIPLRARASIECRNAAGVAQTGEIELSWPKRE